MHKGKFYDEVYYTSSSNQATIGVVKVLVEEIIQMII